MCMVYIEIFIVVVTQAVNPESIAAEHRHDILIRRLRRWYLALSNQKKDNASNRL